MPNPNYIKGRRKEYAICKALKEQGFDIAQRTAGSHSPIDVIAISKDKRLIKLIQAKPTNYPQAQTKKLLIENKDLNGEYAVEFKVI